MTDSLTSNNNNHSNNNNGSTQSSVDRRINKNLFIFNYSNCLEMVGNDEEFLKEIMEEYLITLDDTSKDFRAWNKTHTGYHVSSVACNLKGASAYLCCDEMKELAITIFELSKRIDPWYNRPPLTGEALQRIYEEILQLEMEFLVAKERLVEELRKYEIYHPDEKKNQQLKRQESKEVEV